MIDNSEIDLHFVISISSYIKWVINQVWNSAYNKVFIYIYIYKLSMGMEEEKEMDMPV